MTTILRSSLEENSTHSTIHSIPVEIHFDGDANVKQYFDKRATLEGEGGDLKSTFRGRPLNGKDVEIPSGYKGVIVSKKKIAASDQQDQTLHIEKTFDKFTYWNLETPPTSCDTYLRSLDWLQVAHVIHDPLVDESERVSSSPNER